MITQATDIVGIVCEPLRQHVDDQNRRQVLDAYAPAQLAGRLQQGLQQARAAVAVAASAQTMRLLDAFQGARFSELRALEPTWNALDHHERGGDWDAVAGNVLSKDTFDAAQAGQQIGDMFGHPVFGALAGAAAKLAADLHQRLTEVDRAYQGFLQHVHAWFCRVFHDLTARVVPSLQRDLNDPGGRDRGHGQPGPQPGSPPALALGVIAFVVMAGVGILIVGAALALRESPPVAASATPPSTPTPVEAPAPPPPSASASAPPLSRPRVPVPKKGGAAVPGAGGGNRGSAAEAGAATQPTGGSTSPPAPGASRTACLQTCIGKCQDDADCERSCAGGCPR